MSMVVFVIVLLLVSDRAGCDMRRAGLGQAGPTQLHDIASGKYYLRRRTDHCEGERTAAGGREGRQGW